MSTEEQISAKQARKQEVGQVITNMRQQSTDLERQLDDISIEIRRMEGRYQEIEFDIKTLEEERIASAREVAKEVQEGE